MSVSANVLTELKRIVNHTLHFVSTSATPAKKMGLKHFFDHSNFSVSSGAKSLIRADRNVDLLNQ